MSEETLAFTDDGIEIPDGVNLSDGVVFRARGVTVDHKPGTPDRSFYPAVDERHLQEEQEGIENEHLDAYEVSIKPYGEEAETYRVAVPATDGGTVGGSTQQFTHRHFNTFLKRTAELGWTVELVYEDGGYNWEVGGIAVFEESRHDWSRFGLETLDWRDKASEGGIVAGRTVYQSEEPGEYDLGGGR